MHNVNKNMITNKTRLYSHHASRFCESYTQQCFRLNVNANMIRLTENTKYNRIGWQCHSVTNSSRHISLKVSSQTCFSLDRSCNHESHDTSTANKTFSKISWLEIRHNDDTMMMKPPHQWSTAREIKKRAGFGCASVTLLTSC